MPSSHLLAIFIAWIGLSYGTYERVKYLSHHFQRLKMNNTPYPQPHQPQPLLAFAPSIFYDLSSWFPNPFFPLHSKANIQCSLPTQVQIQSYVPM